MTTNTNGTPAAAMAGRETIESLRAAQDAWAAHFWMYPNETAQSAFQAAWLVEHGHPEKMVGPDGLAWGAF